MGRISCILSGPLLGFSLRRRTSDRVWRRFISLEEGATDWFRDPLFVSRSGAASDGRISSTAFRQIWALVCFIHLFPHFSLLSIPSSSNDIPTINLARKIPRCSSKHVGMICFRLTTLRKESKVDPCRDHATPNKLNQPKPTAQPSRPYAG